MTRRLSFLLFALVLINPAVVLPAELPPSRQAALGTAPQGGAGVQWLGGAGQDEARAGAGNAAQQADPEIRGFWVDAFHDGIKTPAQISQLIADAHTANANALFVQVRRRGDSYYNRSVEPRAADGDLDPTPFDPLASLIEAAHGANPPLQVHAWAVAFPVWSSGYSTTDPTRHVYYRHGCGYGCDWNDPDNWITYRYNSGSPVPDYQLDPGHPAAARYTVDVVLYLLRHYDVDGINLDYIRYYGSEYGYNKVSVDRFNAAYGRTGLPDPNDETWKAWRREQVTSVVRRVYLEALAVKPDLIVSAATIAWGNGPDQAGGWENSSAYQGVFQDWRAWLEEGILDLAVPMNYDREHQPPQDQYFRNWVEWEKDHQYNRGVAPSPAAYLNYISGSLTQAHVVQAPSGAGNHALGVVFYSYASTNLDGLPNSTFYSALSQPSPYGTPPFPTWVAPPALPWKMAPTAGHLMGWAIGPAGPLDRVQVSLTGPVNRTLLTDSSGFFGAVDLPPGGYTITLPAPATSPLYATVTAGRVSIATVAPPPAEAALRALLVDADHDGFKTSDQVDVLLADARAAHLNTIIVQVRRYGRLYYDSLLEPRIDDPDLTPGFDPLAYLLQQTHSAEEPLEVYAWLPVLSAWDQDLGTPPPGHVMIEHPEWLTQNLTGTQPSYGEYYLDPGHPGVLSYTAALALDLVSRYPVDGLFLGSLYYPYEGSGVGYPVWGYNATSVERFHAFYGGSGSPTPDDPLWTDWRRDQLSALLRQIYVRCTDLRPHLRIATEGVAWGSSPDQAGGWEQSSAYGQLLQDWRAWLEEGIVDLAAPMNYDREYETNQRAWYDSWLAWEQSNAGRRGILVLQGAFLNYPEHSLDQAGRVPGNALGFASYVPANLYADPEGNSRYIQPPRQPWYYTPEAEWWLWRSLATPYGYTDPANGTFTATAPIFPSIVPTPTLAWKDVPTRGHAAGWVVGPGLVPLTVPVTVTLSGPQARVLRSDGQGFFGAVDLPPGGYEATVQGAAPSFHLLPGTVEAGQVAWFESCWSVEQVQVQGPLALLAGQTGHYEAAAQPAEASQPITFTWDNGARGPTASYSWTVTGNYTIAVTGTNACGTGPGSLAVRVLETWPHHLYLPLVLKRAALQQVMLPLAVRSAALGPGSRSVRR